VSEDLEGSTGVFRRRSSSSAAAIRVRRRLATQLPISEDALDASNQGRGRSPTRETFISAAGASDASNRVWSARMSFASARAVLPRFRTKIAPLSQGSRARRNGKIGSPSDGGSTTTTRTVASPWLTYVGVKRGPSEPPR
jgi:hypothetical protein